MAVEAAPVMMAGAPEARCCRLTSRAEVEARDSAAVVLAAVRCAADEAATATAADEMWTASDEEHLEKKLAEKASVTQQQAASSSSGVPQPSVEAAGKSAFQKAVLRDLAKVYGNADEACEEEH